MSARIFEGSKLWAFCFLVLVCMAWDLVTRVILTGLCIATGWWLLRKVAAFCFGRERRYTVASEKAKEVVPSYTSFR